MTTLRDLLPDLEPPAHGIVKLRARLRDEKQRRQRRSKAFVFAPALAAATLLFVFVVPQRMAPIEHPSLREDWPALELTVDGHPYQPIVDDGIIWIVP